MRGKTAGNKKPKDKTIDRDNRGPMGKARR